MTFFQLYSLFASGIIAPGPASVMVIKSAMIKRSYGLKSALGIGLSDATYIFISFFGITRLIEKYTFLPTTMRIIGGLFLIFVGISSFLSGISKKRVEFTYEDKNNHFLRGYLTNFTNPYSIVFSISILPTAVSVSEAVGTKLLYLIILVLTSYGWFTILALLSSLKVINEIYINNFKKFDIIFGIILTFFGLKFLVSG